MHASVGIVSSFIRPHAGHVMVEFNTTALIGASPNIGRIASVGGGLRQRVDQAFIGSNTSAARLVQKSTLAEATPVTFSSALRTVIGHTLQLMFATSRVTVPTPSASVV